MPTIINILGVLLAFGSILFLAVVFTRFLAGKTKRAMKGQHINIVESVSLGMDKQLHLVKAGEEFVLIASAGKSITFLTNLKLENYSTEEAFENTTGFFDFKSFFEKYVQMYKDKKKADSSTEANVNSNLSSTSDGDAFKRNLTRLRDITTVINKHDKQSGDESTNEK